MFKKTKHGIEIDSQATDKSNAPRFGKRSYKPEPEESPKPFGKKKARKSKAAKVIEKAKKK